MTTYRRYKTEAEIDAQTERIIEAVKKQKNHFVGCGNKYDLQSIYQIARREKAERGYSIFKR